MALNGATAQRCMWFCRLHRKSSGSPSLWPQALTQALKVNKTLTNINLGGNYIGKEGAEAWGSATGGLWCLGGGIWHMDGGRDFWESQVVLGGCTFQKVSDMAPHQFEQRFNLTEVLGLVGLNFPLCCYQWYKRHLLHFLLTFPGLSPWVFEWCGAFVVSNCVSGRQIPKAV